MVPGCTYTQQVSLRGVGLLVSATSISNGSIPQKFNTLTETDHDATRHLCGVQNLSGLSLEFKG